MKLRYRRIAVVIVAVLMIMFFLLLIWTKVSHPARTPDLWLFDLAVLGLVLAAVLKDYALDAWRRDPVSTETKDTPSEVDESSAQEMPDFSSKNDFSLTE